MFTGLVEETGTIRELVRESTEAVLRIRACKILKDVKPGDSIAVNGVCLTVTACTEEEFTADVMHETLKRTAFSALRAGSPVNLERAVQAGGRFGGHLVTGHIDGTGRITNIQRDGIAVWYTIRTEPEISRYLIKKGSVAVDGISLTVAEVSGSEFRISVIPHTLEHTILPQKRIRDLVNLENDCIGKYIEKFAGGADRQGVHITEERLLRLGY